MTNDQPMRVGNGDIVDIVHFSVGQMYAKIGISNRADAVPSDLDHFARGWHFKHVARFADPHFVPIRSNRRPAPTGGAVTSGL